VPGTIFPHTYIPTRPWAIVVNEVPGQTFDLTALAAENDRLSAPTRRRVFGASLFFALAGATGIGLLVRGARAGAGDSDTAQLAILVVGGFFLAVYDSSSGPTL
jgi:hypothetical protein